jgi:hypothetical protein
VHSLHPALSLENCLLLLLLCLSQGLAMPHSTHRVTPLPVRTSQKTVASAWFCHTARCNMMVLCPPPCAVWAPNMGV